MRKRNLCNICEILKYQNFAMSAKHKYQVTRYLKLAQTARNRIINKARYGDDGNADTNDFFCSKEHTAMAGDILIKHSILLVKLRTYKEESRKRIMRELQKSAFKHAENVIIHGYNSIEALESRMELDRRKHNLGVRKRQKAQTVA